MIAMMESLVFDMWGMNMFEQAIVPKPGKEYLSRVQFLVEL
jgi:hypothetical protein